MKDYILFVDTETSGSPKNWNAPYTPGAWPYIVQIAWIICKKNGEAVKSENHYIKAIDFTVERASEKVHGITDEFLLANGELRPDVFRALSQDLEKYQPLIVGHFMDFDNHMLEMGFRRAGLDNNARDFPRFCTMKATRKLGRNPLQPRYLRLDELYLTLFHKKLENHHDALADAKATAECFFEVWRRGDIDEEIVASQAEKDQRHNSWPRLFWMAVAGALLVVILYLLIML